MVVLLISTLAHLKLIPLNYSSVLNLYTYKYMHLYTYTTCVSVYTGVHTCMCVSCGFFQN